MSYQAPKKMNPIKMYSIFWFMVFRDLIKQKLGMKLNYDK